MTPTTMSDLVDTLIEEDHWQAIELDGLAQISGAATLNHFGLNPAEFEISLLGCNDARIQELNTDFRDKNQSTNVLSWPSRERGVDVPGEIPELPDPIGEFAPEELGDIAIAYETCKKEAEMANKPLTAHVTHLLVHSTLHLLGYDHICDEDAALMQDLESEILATLGQDDPYRTD